MNTTNQFDERKVDTTSTYTIPKKNTGDYTIPKKNIMERPVYEGPNTYNARHERPRDNIPRVQKPREKRAMDHRYGNRMETDYSHMNKRSKYHGMREKIPGPRDNNNNRRRTYSPRDDDNNRERIPSPRDYDNSRERTPSPQDHGPVKGRERMGMEEQRSQRSHVNREMNTVDAPLFVSTPGGYEGPSHIVLDHPIFDGVRGHFQPLDFEKFYTDDMHQQVIDFMVANDDKFDKSGTEIDRGYMRDDDIEVTKHMVLSEFFYSKCNGSRDPRTGDVYRGTLMLDPMF